MLFYVKKKMETLLALALLVISPWESNIQLLWHHSLFRRIIICTEEYICQLCLFVDLVVVN